MRRIGVFVVLSWVLIGSAAADEKKRADELFEEGRKQLAAAGEDPAKVAIACGTFNEAIKLDPEAPGTMLNLGLCNEKLGKYKTALYWFRKAQARAAETSLPDYEKAAKDHTVDLAGKVATIKIEFTSQPPADAKVKIDGQEVKPDEYLHAEVDPGPHTLVAGATGMKIFTHEFTVEGRGGQTIPITFVAGDNSVVVDRGAGRRKAAIYTAIGGGALLAASGVVSGIAKLRYRDCVAKDGTLTPNTAASPSECPGTNDLEATNYANDQQRLARRWGTGFFIAGSIAISIAAVLYFTAPEKERIDRTVFTPTLGPDQIGFAVSGGF
jgi:hypothetical protein